MKRYIRSSESEFIDIIPIEIEIEIPNAIYSSTDDIKNQLFFDEKQELVMSLYDNLTNDICTVCEMNGLELLYYGESDSNSPDGKKSNSRYFDFCIKDHKKSGVIRLVFMLRLTDHRQTRKRRDGSNRKDSLDRRKASRLQEYRAKQMTEHPDSKESVYPFEREIIIGKTVCKTYGDAIRELEQLIANYKRSASGTESSK